MKPNHSIAPSIYHMLRYLHTMARLCQILHLNALANCHFPRDRRYQHRQCQHVGMDFFWKYMSALLPMWFLCLPCRWCLCCNEMCIIMLLVRYVRLYYALKFIQHACMHLYVCRIHHLQSNRLCDKLLKIRLVKKPQLPIIIHSFSILSWEKSKAKFAQYYGFDNYERQISF